PGAPFHRQGYGTLDAAAAAGLARSLRPLGPAATARILRQRQADRDETVLRTPAHPSHTWAWARSYPADDTGNARAHAVDVPAGTVRLKVLSKAVSLAPVGVEQTLRVLDARGVEVASTDQSDAVMTLDLDLQHLDRSAGARARRYDELAFGVWTIRF